MSTIRTGKRSFHLPRLGFLLGLVLMNAGGDTTFSDEAPTAGDSLRIATFNTHLISPLFEKQLADSQHADADAHRVADAIAYDAQDYHSFDVIALNEVWDEDAKDILAKTLAPHFPHYIKNLDVGLDTFADTKVEIFGANAYATVPKIEDSGLMLFSKFPLTPFKAGNKSVHRAFKYFDACAGIDGGAAKGVGLVVLRNPNASRPYVVAFTHLQDGNADVRDLQLYEIARLVQHVRAANEGTVRGEVFVLGDLNIVGCNLPETKPTFLKPDLPGMELTYPKPGLPGSKPGLWQPDDPEWARTFGNKESYFTYPLYDAWAWTTSPFDRGYTNPGGSSRLDYIVHEFEEGTRPTRCSTCGGFSWGRPTATTSRSPRT